MEDLEIKAINSAEHPPSVWRRYVDDTVVVLRTSERNKLLEHITCFYPHIHFTEENKRANGFMLFRDTLMLPEPERLLPTTVYRKPSHTDQYLQWDSHHNLSDKFNVINTLTHTAKTVCFTQQLLKNKITLGNHCKAAHTRLDTKQS